MTQSDAGGPSASPPELQLLRLVADRTLRFNFGSWYWGDAIAIDGLLAANRVAPGPYRDQVVSCLERWARWAPMSFDDALAPGQAVMQLEADGALPRPAADRIVTALERLPLLDGTVPALEPHKPQFRFGVCIDAVYHLPTMALLAGDYKGAHGAEASAIHLATRILEVLRCPTGWAQWHDFSREANNAISWSRGLGWALLGLLDLLELVDLGAAGAVVEAAGNIFEALAEAQAPSGHWPAVLADPEAPEETSTAAFFVAAALHPRAASVGTPDRTKLKAAAGAVLGAIAPDGSYTGVSADILPSWDLTSYERFPVELSPWGQGAALRALVALVTAGDGIGPQIPTTGNR